MHRSAAFLILATLTAGAAGASSATPASAQGLFDFLFGGGRMRVPPRASSYADPLDGPRGDALQHPSPAIGGPQGAFCVRLCDGRHFPVTRPAAATSVQLCQAMCPASETKVFSGRGIDHAVASDGSRYAGLKTAFLYRDRVVPGCTCNGKNAFGLVPLKAQSDPTLRPGDMVATADGLVAFKGGRGKEAQFIPVDPAKLPKALREKVSSLEMAPESQVAPESQIAQVGQVAQVIQDATTGITGREFSTVHPDRHAQFAR